MIMSKERFFCSLISYQNDTLLELSDMTGHKSSDKKLQGRIISIIDEFSNSNSQIKIGKNKAGIDILVLTSQKKDKELVIKDYNKVLSLPELQYAVAKIKSNINKNGYINLQNAKKATKKPKRNHSLKGTLVKVGAFALCAGVFIGALSYEGESKDNNYETEVSNSQVVSESVLKKMKEIASNFAYEEAHTVHIPLAIEDYSETDKAKETRELYYNIISEIAPKYGLDPELVLAIATQERGIHSNRVDAGGGLGLMQIQVSIWAKDGINLTYYELNPETGLFEEHWQNSVSLDTLKDERGNIEFACKVLQKCLIDMNYNIPLAIQTYNMGQGSVKRIIDAYANSTGKTREDVISNPSDMGWLDYRAGVNGDSNYIENINKWVGYERFKLINVLTGEPVIVEFQNPELEIGDKVM